MTRRLWAQAVGALLLVACAGDEQGDVDTTVASITTAPGAPTSARPVTTAARSTEPSPTTAATTPVTSTPPTTAGSTVDDATAYAMAGPSPVGVTTLRLRDGPAVEVWYPAVDGTTGTVTYDVRDFVPQAIRDLLTAYVPATYSFEGRRDADVADGSFPVVLFSHGFTGIRLQSSFLTAHLASWRMIVVAPDHPSRDLANVLSGTASGDVGASVEDLLASLELVTAASARRASPFSGRVDAERVAIVGHSAGGGTALLAATDDRVDGYVSMASGSRNEQAALPDRPSFFLAGTVDRVVPPTRTRAAYERAPAPSRYWELTDVGHNGFDDFCTFGGGTGIIGIAEASGLGPLLDERPELRRLGEDGCVPPAAPVRRAQPIIRHGVTAWLRSLFGIDEQPIGLGPEVDGAYDLAVTVESRP